jgi:hypothetical protein
LVELKRITLEKDFVYLYTLHKYVFLDDSDCYEFPTVCFLMDARRDINTSREDRRVLFTGLDLFGVEAEGNRVGGVGGFVLVLTIKVTQK